MLIKSFGVNYLSVVYIMALAEPIYWEQSLTNMWGAFTTFGYDVLEATGTGLAGGKRGPVITHVINFLQNENDNTGGEAEKLYNEMKNQIETWKAGGELRINLGIALNAPLTTLRIQVIRLDGHVAYDTEAGTANDYANIGIPATNFSTTGKYKIQDNQGAKSYFMGPQLSKSGSFYVTKNSHETASKALSAYYGNRLGSVAAPIGIVVLSGSSTLDEHVM